MTPEPVSLCPEPCTLIETTDGSTFAATAAYPVLGSAETVLPESDAIVRPGLLDDPPPSSIAAPTPTPIPPKTRAATPAAAAGERHRDRCFDGPHCGSVRRSSGSVSA